MKDNTLNFSIIQNAVLVNHFGYKPIGDIDGFMTNGTIYVYYNNKQEFLNHSELKILTIKSLIKLYNEYATKSKCNKDFILYDSILNEDKSKILHTKPLLEMENGQLYLITNRENNYVSSGYSRLQFFIL